ECHFRATFKYSSYRSALLELHCFAHAGFCEDVLSTLSRRLESRAEGLPSSALQVSPADLLYLPPIFTPLAVRLIRLVIPLLHPGHQRQHLVNRRGTQGQDHV